MFIWCHGIKWRLSILRLEVMFDERSQVFYRGKKPGVFLVFQICFVDLIKVQRQYLRPQSLNFHQQLLLIQTPFQVHRRYLPLKRSIFRL